LSGNFTKGRQRTEQLLGLQVNVCRQIAVRRIWLVGNV